MGIVFVCAPLLLSTLGASRFGVLMIVLLIPSLAVQLDFGLGTSAIRRLSQELESGPIRLRGLLRIYFIAFALLALLSGMLMLLAGPSLLDLLGFRAILSDAEARSLVFASAVWFAIALISTSPSLIARASNSLAALASVQTLGSLGIWGGALMLVRGGHSLASVAWLGVATNLVSALVLATAVRRHVSHARAPGRHIEILRGDTSFSANVFLAQLAGLVAFQMDRVLIASLASPAVAGAYALCTSISGRMSAAVGAMGGFVFPHVSRMHAAGEEAQLGAFIAAMERSVAVLIVPMLLPGVMLAAPFLQLWVKDFATPELITTFRILWVALALPAFSIPIGNAVIATGIARLAAQFAWLTASVESVGIVLLTPRWGLIGAAVAVLAGMSTSFVFAWVAKKRLRLGRSQDLRFWISLAVGLLGQFAVLAAFAGAPPSWPLLLVAGTLSWSVFFIARAILGSLFPEEIGVAARFISMFRQG